MMPTEEQVEADVRETVRRELRFLTPEEVKRYLSPRWHYLVDEVTQVDSSE